MAVDFSKLLQVDAGEIKRPPALPEGTYRGFIDKREFKESSEKKTPYVQYTIQLREATEDVDPAGLEGIEVTKKTLYKDYYLTEQAMWRLTEMLTSLGIPLKGRKLEEVIDEALKQEVMVKVAQEMDRREPTAPPRNVVETLAGVE
jgi:Protein of unknown function (DUF669)